MLHNNITKIIIYLNTIMCDLRTLEIIGNCNNIVSLPFSINQILLSNDHINQLKKMLTSADFITSKFRRK